MAVYERLSSDKKWPPESRKNRRQLQFGRYDYHVEDEQTSSEQQEQKKKRSQAEVDAIVQRLRQEIRPEGEQPSQTGGQSHVHRTVSEAEASAIFDRLRSCDHGRWPVESRLGRRDLGQSRYDYYQGEEASKSTPRVTKAELEAIVGRLSTYDVAKTPPNSRALEIKQAKGGAN